MKDRVREIARDQGRTFNDIWTTLVLERFLVRLSRSAYLDKLIFKGGMLLSKYLPLGRETVDLDFLAVSIDAEAAEIKRAVSEVLNVSIDDGFSFETIEIVEAAQPHMNYPGYSVAAVALLGGTRTKITLDIGLGDVVEPQQMAISLTRSKNRPVFEDSVALQVYPAEFIFAEKLETVHYRGAFNSRMKDFYDLWRMIKDESLLDRVKLKKALTATFARRETDLQSKIVFGEADLQAFEIAWGNFRRGIGEAERGSLPSSFGEILKIINAWVTALFPESGVGKRL